MHELDFEQQIIIECCQAAWRLRIPTVSTGPSSVYNLWGVEEEFALLQSQWHFISICNTACCNVHKAKQFPSWRRHDLASRQFA